MRLLLRFFLLALTTLPLAFAQSGNATLDGSVTDPAGALIPGAKVTVTNLATGVARTVETTSAGLYVVTALIPGVYKVELKAPGFRSKEITGIQLVIDQQARIDVQLEVGSASQEMTVTGEAAPLLQTAEASVGFVVQKQQ